MISKYDQSILNETSHFQRDSLERSSRVDPLDEPSKTDSLDEPVIKEYI